MISIIIPVRNLSKYLIDECLPAIDNQTYKNFEVIVVTDVKFKNDINLIKKYSWLKIILSEKHRRPAEKRDFGAQKSRGDIIAFIDDDAHPDKNWLKHAFSLFQQASQPPRLRLAVCGPGILPKKTNFWEKVFDEILKSWIGNGGFGYRFIQQKQRYVDDYPSMNFFIRKKIFFKLGGFNNNYWPGEDSKLCEDLVYKEKSLIFYDPRVLVFHHRRNNLTGYLEQHSNYGFHRGAFFAHGDRNSRRLSYLIPSFFVSYLFIFVLWLLAVGYWQLVIGSWLLASFPLVFYLTLMIYLSLKSFFNTRNLIISFVSPLVLFLTHLIYGIMFIKGFIKGLFKKDKIY